MKISASGVRGKKAFEKMLAERRKANERGTDLEADYDKFSRRVVKRDAFPVLTNPKMVAANDAGDIREREPVLGVTIGDEARAYPISIMGVHELVNDTMRQDGAYAAYLVSALPDVHRVWTRHRRARRYDFGHEGVLYRQSFIMYDKARRTRSGSTRRARR